MKGWHERFKSQRHHISVKLRKLDPWNKWAYTVASTTVSNFTRRKMPSKYAGLRRGTILKTWDEAWQRYTHGCNANEAFRQGWDLWLRNAAKAVNIRRI